MVKISVAIMTLNEERNIGRCLGSVHDIADEILVVDSFSTDRTEEICREYGVRFMKHPFEGYREQRIYVISQARYDWVLLIDADEALSEELKVSIRAVREHPQADGYYFNRLANYCGQWIRHGGWYPDRKLRLFDRRKASVEGRNPHDEVRMHPGATKQFLRGDLLHYTFYTVEQHIQQINRFTSIQAQAKYLAGRRPSLFQILFAPIYKFTRFYIFRLGFLDGYYGYLISKNEAFSTFLKHAKLKALHRSGE